MRRFIAVLGATVLFCIPMFAFADTVQVNFESPNYTAGNINGQGGWSNTGLYDANVIASGVANFGLQSLQISDAKTSGSFGDQTIAPAIINSAGETTANAGTFATGTIQSRFEAQFDIDAIAPGSGDFLSASPDRGDGARMSYLRFEDQADGIHVYFDDVTASSACTPAGCVPFNEVTIATLDNSKPHTVKFVMDFVDGPSNDTVKIYIDGTLVHTGTTWENYYRFDPEQVGGGNFVPAVRTLLFREKGTANPADMGKGFLVDNLTLTSGTTPNPSVVVVTPASLNSWTTDDTRPGGAVNYVTDASTPAGTGALQLTTDNTTASKAQYMQYINGIPTPLSSVTELSYYTKQNSALFTEGDASYQLPVLLNGTTGFTTFVFEPYENGTVTSGTWQHWDVAKGQFWSSKTVTCSNGTITAGAGGAPFYTLSQIETMCPSAVVGGFGVNIGSNNPGYDVETDLVSFNNTAYDFDPAPAPTTAVVTIYKYVDGQHATVENANNATFPFTATYQASNIAGGAAGSDPFTIGATDNNVSTGNAYEIKTIPLALGASYSASENVTGNDVVGASCADGKPFAIAGYSSGNTFNEAFTNASSSTAAPQFTYLQNDKYVIVWNKTCPAAPPVAPQVHIFKFVDGVQATAQNNTATFPMNASWVSSTLGTVPSVGFTLSPAGWGASDAAYEASYVGGAQGDTYATNEVLTTTVVGQQCDGSHTYNLAGYTTGNTLDEAKTGTPSLDSPSFTNLQSDKYVIVWNQTCPTTASLTVTKSSIGGNGTFSFTSDIPGHASFQITTANNTGSMTFDGLVPGTYHVTEVNQPKGWTQTDTSCDDVPLSAGQSQSCIVTDTNNKQLGSIRGSKFEDWDGDGSAFETRWEKGLKGWTIYIDKNNNNQLDPGEMTATTDKNGLYIFSGIAAGTYTIREVQQSGWTQTYPSANAMSDKWVVNLAAGQNAKKKDFGNFKLGSISGLKYNDLNGNGHKEPKEPTLSGITIKLKNPQGSTVSTVTGADGSYSFGNLGAGKYTLTEVVPAGWRQTDHPGSVRIVSGTAASKENFGNTQKPAKHGRGSEDSDD